MILHEYENSQALLLARLGFHRRATLWTRLAILVLMELEFSGLHGLLAPVARLILANGL
jgi:hypothetical protein